MADINIVIDDHVVKNEDEEALVSWKSPRGREMGLNWGEYLCTERQDCRSSSNKNGGSGNDSDDTDQDGSDDDISEAEEEEDDTIAWMEEELLSHTSTRSLSLSNNCYGISTGNISTCIFTSFSEEVLDTIFAYAYILPSDMLPIERVCKRFYKVLRADGNFWDRHQRYESNCRVSCPLLKAMTTRDRDFILQGLRFVRKSQKSEGNVIVSILGEHRVCNKIERKIMHKQFIPPNETTIVVPAIAAEEVRSIAFKIIFKIARGGIVRPFRLRGDTVGFLCEIIQACMITKLENANLLSVSREQNYYPTVTKEDLIVAEKIQVAVTDRRPRQGGIIQRSHCVPSSFPKSNSNSNSNSNVLWIWPEDNCLDEDILPSEVRQRIIRRIAYQAGIVKMTGEAFAAAEAELLHLLAILLVDAYESAIEAPPTKCIITDEDATPHINRDEILIFSNPPPPLYFWNGETSKFEWVVTIVPSHIKSAALSRNLVPHDVYVDTWISSPGFTVETEKEIEASYYWCDQSQHKGSNGRVLIIDDR